jgi:hypothetical protein
MSTDGLFLFYSTFLRLVLSAIDHFAVTAAAAV